MNAKILSMIKCSNCGGDEFSADLYEGNINEIIDGRIICRSCNVWYRIENGILDMLSLSLRRMDLHSRFMSKYGLNPENIQNIDKDEQKDGQIKFFARFSKTYDKAVADSPYFSTFDRVVFGDWINRNLNPGQYVLDVGCGSGVQSILSAQKKINTIGLDISEEMLSAAQEKVEEMGITKYVNLIVGDAENIPLRSESFDACFMVGTLHHVRNPEMVIISATDKLRKGGDVFTSDNHKSPVRFLFDFLMKIWKLYDEKARDEPLFIEAQLNGWFRKAGIKSNAKISTYLPPHIFFFLSRGVGDRVLKITNALFRAIPIVRYFGGIIVVEGKKG